MTKYPKLNSGIWTGRLKQMYRFFSANEGIGFFLSDVSNELELGRSMVYVYANILLENKILSKRTVQEGQKLFVAYYYGTFKRLLNDAEQVVDLPNPVVVAPVVSVQPNTTEEPPKEQLPSVKVGLVIDDKTAANSSLEYGKGKSEIHVVNPEPPEKIVEPTLEELKLTFDRIKKAIDSNFVWQSVWTSKFPFRTRVKVPLGFAIVNTYLGFDMSHVSELCQNGYLVLDSDGRCKILNEFVQ